MNFLYKKLNNVYFFYRKWRAEQSVRVLPTPKNISIEKPTFYVGLQGGGLTLLARIMHRHPRAVYLTGNHKYWAGGNEMHSVLAKELPESLAYDRKSLYASNKYIQKYRKTADDVTPEDREKFISILKKLIYINKPRDLQKTPRFFDKSQTFTVKVSYLNELLKNQNPKFILITRNPFAWIWRTASKKHKGKTLTKEKLQPFVEHWYNSYKCALKDKKEADLKTWRFEDLLKNPRKKISEICEHVELPFYEEMLPSKDDKIPFGSNWDAHLHKWYPLRPDVNEEYLERMPDWAISMIKENCGDLIDKFDYTPEGP